MLTVEINWLAMLLAVLASMVIGMVWYGIFANQWAAATGKKVEDLKKETATSSYVLSVVTAFVSAYVFAHWIAFAGVANPDSTGIALGATSGFWAWLGFIGPITAMNTAWEKRSWNLWLINNGNHLVTLLVVGMIIAGMM